MRSNNFDVGSFGNILPYVKDQYGKVESAVDINGPLNELHTDGFFILRNGQFTSRQNNLNYNFGIKTLNPVCISSSVSNQNLSSPQSKEISDPLPSLNK